jgi:predicted phosphohydrolase
MAIFITGDMHGDYRETSHRLGSRLFPKGKDLNKDDIVIITGDFGWLWFPDGHVSYRKDLAGLKWLKEKPWTTLFVDGNHENHDILDLLPSIDKFDGKVGYINDSVFHLKRGEVYNIQGNKFFSFGGAESTKTYNKRKILEQIQGKNWWEREIPSENEFLYALENLKKHNFNIDYILSHTAPIRIVEQVVKSLDCYEHRVNDPVSKMLSDFEKDLNFKKWFFGHFHNNLDFEEKFFCSYARIIEI